MVFDRFCLEPCPSAPLNAEGVAGIPCAANAYPTSILGQAPRRLAIGAR